MTSVQFTRPRGPRPLPLWYQQHLNNQSLNREPQTNLLSSIMQWLPRLEIKSDIYSNRSWFKEDKFEPKTWNVDFIQEWRIHGGNISGRPTLAGKDLRIDYLYIVQKKTRVSSWLNMQNPHLLGTGKPFSCHPQSKEPLQQTFSATQEFSLSAKEVKKEEKRK